MQPGAKKRTGDLLRRWWPAFLVAILLAAGMIVLTYGDRLGPLALNGIRRSKHELHQPSRWLTQRRQAALLAQ